MKKIILDELFFDVNYKNCFIDILVKDKQELVKAKNTLSKEAVEFLNGNILLLREEAYSGNILFFRKYNYEKILNSYLEKNKVQ